MNLALKPLTTNLQSKFDETVDIYRRKLRNKEILLGETRKAVMKVLAFLQVELHFISSLEFEDIFFSNKYYFVQ